MHKPSMLLSRCDKLITSLYMIKFSFCITRSIIFLGKIGNILMYKLK